MELNLKEIKSLLCARVDFTFAVSQETRRRGEAEGRANLILSAIIFPTVFGLVRKRDENTQ